MQDMTHPLRLFISFAQADVRWLDRLDKHLSSLRRQKLISVWDDRKIKPGSERKQERTAHLNTAKIILLLISPDFMDSEECYHEMEQAIAKHGAGATCVIPVLLRPVDLEGAPFYMLQSLPTNGKSITHWQSSDDAMQDVAKGIRNVITELIKQELTEDPVVKSPDPENKLSQYDTARSRYLENVCKRYSSVRLPLGPAEGFSLQAIFQPLSLRRDPSIAEDLQRDLPRLLFSESSEFISLHQSERKQTEYKEPITLIAENGDDALKKSPQGRMVILGGPGTGKTVTLKHLVGECARNAIYDQKAPTPIFISLTDLVHSTKTLQRYLIDVVEDMGVESRYADTLWKDIEVGRSFICLDSLDEVAPQHRIDIIELINMWASHAGNTWIIGSRFTEYKGGQFRQGQFAEWELLPMNHSMRLQLSRRLFPELVSLLPPNTKLVLSPETFVELLEHHPHAATWGENPLLFSIAAVVALQTGGLPSCRAALYHEVVEAILQTRERDPFWCSLLMRMLTKLALWLHQSKGRTFTKSDLLTFFLDVQGKSLAETIEMARRIISSGIVEVVARDTYSFRHQTFQEYLAAAELSYLLTDQKPSTREDAWLLAWSKRTYSRWAEVLRLMVGVLVQNMQKRGKEVAQSWIRALLEQRTTKEGDPGNLGLALALKSLAEVSEIVGWKTSSTANLEESLIVTWTGELHSNAYHKRENLARLAYDVGHLRKSLLEKTLSQILAQENDKYDSRTISTVLGFLGENVPLEPLEVAFKIGDSDVRTAAIQVLARQRERVSIEMLISALKDESKDVRQAAVQILETQGERVPIEMLISALKDESKDVRQAAVQILETQGERVPIEMLISALKDWQDTAWQAILAALGVQEEEMPLEALLEMLDPALKGWQGIARQIVEKLERAAENGEIHVLLRMLLENTEARRHPRISKARILKMRTMVRKLLSPHRESSQLNFVPSPPSKDVEPDMREATANALRGLQIEMLASDLSYRQSMARQAVVQVLETQGERVSIEVLISALKDESKDVRQAAVKALGAQGERAPLLELISALKDESEDVRQAALKVLRTLKEQLPIEVLLDSLLSARKFKDRFWREELVNALIDVSRQVPVVPLEKLVFVLHDENEHVREAIVQVLGALGEQVPVEVLLAALKDESRFVQEAVLQVLGAQGERTPIEVLIAILQDKSAFVREAAIRALGMLKEHVPIEVLLAALQDEDKFIRRAAAQALIGQGERVPADILMKALEDKDKDVHRLMIQVIKKIDPEALSITSIEALKALQQQPIGIILNSIVQGFSAGNSDDLGLSLQFLLKALEQLLDWPDMTVRVKAIHVLGRIRRYIPDSTIQRLLEFRQHDPDPPIRMAADDALADILSLETGIEDE